MAISSAVCLNLPQLKSPATLTQSKNQLIPSQFEERWRKQCLVGMACMVIGVTQMGNLADGSNHSVTTAKETSPPLVFVESHSNTLRWSDKRMCPPWKLNSLETIVPENLPRPFTRRRWEEVRNYNPSNNEPIVKVIVKSRNDCFSM